MKRKLLIIFLISILIIGCKNSKKTSKIDISGSTTVLPLISAAAQSFLETHKEKAINVQGGGSSAGIEQVAIEIVDIGMSSRDLKGEELEQGLIEFPIAIDAIAIIVNPKNNIRNLTEEQARSVFSGKVRNWKQIGGNDEEIIVVNRDEASGTREAFKKIVMGEDDFLKEAVVQPGSGQVRSIIASTPGAIGYISMGYVTSDVNSLIYNGIEPKKENVLNGNYKIQRKLHLFTKGQPGGLEKEFIDFILSTKVQEEIIGVEFIPISN